MKRTLLSLVAITSALILASSIPSERYSDIIKLEKGGLLHLYGAGRGGYSGTCISLHYTNTGADSLFGILEPGSIFVSDDPAMQDIIVTRRDQFVVAPRASGEMIAWGYCCRARRHSPAKDNRFSKIIQARDTMQRLATYLNSHYFSTDAEQHAVWVISDGNPIASIPEGKHRENVPLRKKVCELIGEEYPWYSVEYYKSDRPFSGNPERVYGEIAYQVATSCLVDIVLYRQDGTTMKVLMQGMPTQPGRRTYWFDEKKIFAENESYTLKIYYDRAERFSATISL